MKQDETLRFIVNYAVDEEFRKYVRRIGGFYKDEEKVKQLEAYVKAKLFNLIVWKKNNEIIGHAIWHESNTEEHRKGDPREKKDREILETLLNGRKDFVELHEIWLLKEHRRKGYGRRFFRFFEHLLIDRGYNTIIYYAYHPAAITICRQRGYREVYGFEETGLEGDQQTCYVFCLSLHRL